MSDTISNIKNQQIYDKAMEIALSSVQHPRFIEYWIVQNTGWSGGLSWFNIGGSSMNPLRHSSAADAIAYIDAGKVRANDESIKWRYTHTTVDRCDNKTVTTEEWVEV
jgi:hypothetical protein